MNILDAYPKTQETDVVKVKTLVSEARTAFNSAKDEFDHCFDSFTESMANGDPEDITSVLRRISEHAQDIAEGAMLDLMEAEFVWNSMWN